MIKFQNFAINRCTVILSLLLSPLFGLQTIFCEMISNRNNYKPRDQPAPDSIIRLLIDVITIVRSYHNTIIMVLEIIGGHFLPPPPRAVV